MHIITMTLLSRWKYMNVLDISHFLHKKISMLMAGVHYTSSNAQSWHINNPGSKLKTWVISVLKYYIIKINWWPSKRVLVHGYQIKYMLISVPLLISMKTRGKSSTSKIFLMRTAKCGFPGCTFTSELSLVHGFLFCSSHSCWLCHFWIILDVSVILILEYHRICISRSIHKRLPVLSCDTASCKVVFS